MVERINKVDIVAFGAHPDDIELGCSGTLIEHIKKGYTVGICDLTQGELGTRGSGSIRLQEAEAARIHMGAQWRVNLGLADGFFENNKINQLQIIKILRQARPKLIFINAPTDRHPDHGRASKLVLEASFYSGLSKIELSDKDNNYLEKWRPSTILHYIQDKELEPDLVFDITDAIDQKIECIKKFETQFFNGNKDGVQTPISSEQFFEFIKAKNRVYGRDILADYAEGFITTRKHSIEDLMNLK